MKGKQLMAQTDSNTSKNKFKHLLFHQRTLIEFMVKNGYKPADIARELGVNRSTVSRELKRGSVKQIIAGKTVLKYFAETALEGAVFTLRKDNETIKELTTDTLGQILVEGLTPGGYEFMEISAPAGFILDPTIHEFRIPADAAGEPE